ncbi:MAG: ATP-dependent DNA helicase RecG [Aquificae bacterium]|nr:ATP-dependent DNA helicase RecG [Aquificota bacterium]
MSERSDLKSFVESLLARDGLKLKRSVGVGLFLYNRLAGELPSSLAESLRELDRYPFEKKKAVLKELLKLLKGHEGEPLPPPKPLKAFLKPVSDTPLSTTEKKTLKALGLNTLLDALFYFPVRYEDRRIVPVKRARPGEKVALLLRVKEVRKLNEGPYTVEVVAYDETGTVSLKFKYRNADFAWKAFRKGSTFVAYGKLKSFKGEKYMVHPEIRRTTSEEVGRILPVYYARKKGELEEISSEAVKRRVRKTLQKLSSLLAKYLPEYLPPFIKERRGFPHVAHAVAELHDPKVTPVEKLNQRHNPYHRRAIYDELFVFQLAMLLKRKSLKELKAPKIEAELGDEVLERLPFELTAAQKRVLGEVLADMRKEEPMNRLLQGDVGSGKTVVAMLAALASAKSGYQTAVMVPTEILAHQHFKKFSSFLEPFGVRVVLLTGSLTPSQKARVRELVKKGLADVVVGTHALIQDKVEFNRLGLVVIDEQHRFGVLQRKELIKKGKGLHPHCLVMSATPIPRTLALSVYGDLDLSVIDELPPGRKPVKTLLMFESEREKLYELVSKELEKGNKAYVVYPLVEESEKLELKAATEEVKRWQERFPDRKVLLLHGRMPEKEKVKVMEEFKKDGQILVSTTVIEVGVDVPEATVMVIEDAHRFGLSQLHQLRGRVGRSDREAYCVVVVPDEIKNDKDGPLERLRVFVSTSDGFKIAEEDLKLRGPGELLGVSQSGFLGFHLADLGRSYDRSLLELAREDAEELLKNHRLSEFPDLAELVRHRYGEKLELGLIA